MFKAKNTPLPSSLATFFRCLIILGFLTIYPLAAVLPITFGWENGIIENSQVIVCGLGLLVAIRYAIQAKSAQSRWFWIMLAPLWFIIMWRELSWGACFLPPQSIDPETGGIYTSSVLSYKPIVYPILFALTASVLLVFIIKKQYMTIVQLWKNKDFPLIELLLVAIGALLSTATEGHMSLTLPFAEHFSAGQIQIMEELAEFWVYFSLFAAQYRVHYRLHYKLP